MINKGYSILLCCCLMCFTLSGAAMQTTEQPWKAWIEMNQDGENARITGQFRNDGTEKLNLSYKLTVEREAKSGRSTNHQQSDFEATPGTTTLLSEVNINVSKENYYRISLEVFKGKEKIAVDSLINGTQTNKVIPLSKHAKDEDLELDGLIINETRSKIGRDFYDVFYRSWLAPKEARDFVIRIRELPARGRIARISIEVNNEEVTQRVLQPRPEIIRSQARYAIRIVQQRLIARSAINKEIENEDQQGSGIF